MPRRTVMRRPSYRRPLALLLALAFGMAACGNPAADAPSSSTDDASAGQVSRRPSEGLPTEPARVVVDGLAYRAGKGPVELCATVAESYPPQCDGVPLEDVDIAAIPGVERANDVIWVSVQVTGIWDGRILRADDVARPSTEPSGRASCFGACAPRRYDVQVRCDVSGPAEDATDQPASDVIGAIDNAARNRRDIYAGLWLDGPRVFVAFTDEPQNHRQDLCERYEHELVIVQAPHSYDDLTAIVNELSLGPELAPDTPVSSQDNPPPVGTQPASPPTGFVSSGHDVMNNRVDLQVVFADKATTDALLKRYGTDRLAINSWMRPVD